MRSNENVPVRLRTQQRAKYCLPLLTANCIAAKMYLRDLYQTDLRIPDQNPRPQKTRISTVTDAPFIQLDSKGLQVYRNRKFSEGIFSAPRNIQSNVQTFQHTGLL